MGRNTYSSSTVTTTRTVTRNGREVTEKTTKSWSSGNRKGARDAEAEDDDEEVEVDDDDDEDNARDDEDDEDAGSKKRKNKRKQKFVEERENDNDDENAGADDENDDDDDEDDDEQDEAPAKPAPKSRPVAASTGNRSTSDGLPADLRAGLEAHNTARNAKGVSPLVWDDRLAREALAYAKRLAATGEWDHDANTSDGENLYAFTGRLSQGQNVYVDAVDDWMTEEKDYEAQQRGEPHGDVGHYTQVMWSSTEKVGMAVADNGRGKYYVVARYYPMGNMAGETPFDGDR